MKFSIRSILYEISARISRVSSPRTVFIVLAAFIVISFLINGRPWGVSELKSITGGAGLLDMEVLYTPEQAYSHLAAMGEAGRVFDLTRIIPLDLVFPLIYSLFYAITISWLLHTWLPEGNRWHRLNLVPLPGGVADYLENFGIITMLLAWPAQLPYIAFLTMITGFVKFFFMGLSFLVIIGALLGWIIRGTGKSGAEVPKN
jgi:hypothetical protein